MKMGNREQFHQIIEGTFDDTYVRNEVKTVISRGNRTMEDLKNPGFIKIAKDYNKLVQWFDKSYFLINDSIKKSCEEYKEDCIKNSSLTIDRLKLKLKNSIYEGNPIREKHLFHIFDNRTEVLENKISNIETDFKCPSLEDFTNNYLKEVNKLKRNNNVFKFILIGLPIVIYMIALFWGFKDFKISQDIVEFIIDKFDFFSKIVKYVFKFSILSSIIYIIYVSVIFSISAKRLKNKVSELSFLYYQKFVEMNDEIINEYNSIIDDFNVQVVNIFLDYLDEGFKKINN